MPASTANARELTREQVQAILVQPLTAASVFLAAGPRIFDVTAARPVRIPTDTALIAGTGDPVAGKRTTPLGILNYAALRQITGVGGVVRQRPRRPVGICQALLETINDRVSGGR
jgi:hypothetical protein